MADTTQNIPSRKDAPLRFVTGHEGKDYLGITKDGVKILMPKTQPKNFTRKEVREAVAAVKNKSA